MTLWVGLVFVGSSTIAFIVWKSWASNPDAAPVTRFSIMTPEGTQLSFPFSSSLAISPDGRSIVFAASSLQSGGGQIDPRQGGTGQLYLRRIDDFSVKPIPGTLGGFGPFFSPDGNWIGFVSDGRLRKVALQGGSPITLCAAANFRGGTWGPDDRITFTPEPGGGLWSIPSSGGTPQPLTALDVERGEVNHRFPDILPDGKTVLYTLKLKNISTFDDAKIVAERLDTKERVVLIEGGTFARYVPTGHILYARGGSLYAVPFDEGRLQVTGPPVEMIVGGMMILASGAAEFCFSSTGTLVYTPGGPYPLDLYTVNWIDRRGKVEALIDRPGPFYQLALSPDGLRLAFSMLAANNDIWVHDARMSKSTRLTFADGNRALPVWTPDGKHIVYRAEQTGVGNLYRKAADGSGNEERLTTGSLGQDPSSISPDGRMLAFTEVNQTGGDIWMLPLHEASTPRPFLQTQFAERQAAFSPDGRWLAYTSNETGQDEVFVVPYPRAEGKWQVSSSGGSNPSWSRDGSELFYRNRNTMMCAQVASTPSFRSMTAKVLFELPADVRDVSGISPDNRRFVIVTGQQLALTEINVVLEWFEELTKH